jgi:hypothetical protein
MCLGSERLTFILTLISEDSTRPLPDRVGPLKLEPVVRDDRAADRAGFVPSLKRYLGRSVRGTAVHILLEERDGYQSSNDLFVYGAEDEPARLQVPIELRPHLERVIELALTLSACRRVLLIAEDNGHVTDPDLSAEDAETIDVMGPIGSGAFWRLVELREVLEDSVVIIEGP